VDFPTAIKTCLRKYVEFNGRASRSEFWYFVLFQFLVYVAAAILGAGMGENNVLYGLAALGLLLPALGAEVRRLHDIDRSGWWVLLGLIPIVGSIVLIVWCCKKGSDEANRFGVPASAGAAGAV
jgi:uncharacterized membrane protein YhaH (DUF805 family)